MNKIAIITNIIPTYREHFYDLILNNPAYDVKVFCQDKIAGENIKSVHEKFGNKVQILNSFSPFKNNSLVWQFLPFMSLFRKYDIIVVDGNLRHLSQAFLSTIFRLFGKRIIIWSNVYTFGGNKMLQNIRISWWKLFDNFLMYTEKDVSYLIELGFTKKNILSINNGLNQNLIGNEIKKWNENLLSDFKIKHNIKTNNVIISSGRINKVNDYILGIEALKIIKETVPDILWIIIGNGSEFNNLKILINENNLKENVLLLGEMYDEELKCPWFLISKVFVHPGPIGLSIFNAFCYSLPVVTHNNKSQHGPEFSLFDDKKTGYLFHYKNSNDLASKIMETLQKDGETQAMKKFVYKIVKERYNTDVMASQFLKMIKSV